MSIPTHLSTLVIPPTSPALIRLEKVRKDILAGESFRSIGRKLSCDEKTVRRDYDKLCLPADKLRVILNGADCEPILRAHAREQEQEERGRIAVERERKRKLELAHEHRSGLLSENLKNAIMAFLSRFPGTASDCFRMLKPIQEKCYYVRVFGQQPMVDSIEAAIAATAPAVLPSDAFELIAAVDQWLFRWLMRAEPDREIRDRGIALALREYERSAPMG